MSEAIVVTGLGVVAPTGLGADDHWQTTRAGRTAIGPVRRFDASGYPCQLAGEVPEFPIGEYLPDRLLPQTDHMTRLALIAADFALADAGVDPSMLAEYGMGVVTASSSGGFEFGQRELQKLWSQGSRFVSAYQSFAWFYAVNTGQISIRHGMRGPSGVLVTDQAGGLDAIAQARRKIRSGTDLVVTGGVDGSICPWGWTAQLASRRLSTVGDPDRAYLPFDQCAAGHVPGEGGALLILESAEAANARDRSEWYGEFAGYAATFDPAPGSEREPGLRRAIELCLADAECAPDEVDVVFADGAAIPELDRVEAVALQSVFGPRGVPVTVPKSMTGRLYSGAGALDVATALLALRDQVVPAAVNLEPHPGYELDLVVGDARELPLRTALVLARGQGGFNSALLVRAPTKSRAEI